MTNFEKIKNMSVEERKAFFNHNRVVDDFLYRDEQIDKDIDIVAYNPRICKGFTDKNCDFENPNNAICAVCTKQWLQSEAD